MTGPDLNWWDRVKQPQIAEGLRRIRALVAYFANRDG
jgi:hypothetical protein